MWFQYHRAQHLSLVWSQREVMLWIMLPMSV